MMNNKWIEPAGGQLPRVPLPDDVQECESRCLVPVSLVLNPRVGAETVLIFIESPTFIKRVRRLDVFNLNLQCGIYATQFGPLFSLLWWIGDSTVHPKSSEMYETEINPHEFMELQPFVELSLQEYWHVFMVTLGANELNWQYEKWFEVPNSLILSDGIRKVREVTAKLPCVDFDRAVKEFHRRYSRKQLITPRFNPGFADR